MYHTKKVLSDFEKLLFAIGYIKELKRDIEKLNQEHEQEIKTFNFNKGVLLSEIDELKYILKQDKPESLKLKSYKDQIRALNKMNKKYKMDYITMKQKYLSTQVKLNLTV